MSERVFLPGTQIELVHEFPKGRFKHVLFDFDGTLSLLREGWQRIMGPLCIEMICGDTPATPEITREVWEMIEETTGIQTIFQMERLVDMVRAHGLVPEDRILDVYGYKDLYNDRLMVPVRQRIARIESGECTAQDFTVCGTFDFLRHMAEQGVAMYVFSGTDEADVRNEAEKLGIAGFFTEIWGALRTVEEYSKEKVIRELMARHDLHGTEVLAVGDGPIELRSVKEHGGVALGVASNEATGIGWNEEKRLRLLRSGADLIVPDFGEADTIVEYLFSG